tara:strand:+ start:49488 stop:50471 length:984 start_codon:yes stop_codon:yes gene_type:complete
MEIKLNSYTDVNNKIKENAKKHKVNLDKLKLNLTIERIEYKCKGFKTCLLNALRQMAYKFDYCYYLDVNINDILFECNPHTISNFINKSEIFNKITQILIDNNDEVYLDKLLNTSVCNVNKSVVYSMDNVEDATFFNTNDIKTNNKIVFDGYCNLHQLPYCNGDFIISDITLKKDYAYNDGRRINVSTFICNEESSNSHVLTIENVGTIKTEKLLLRYLNILYLKLDYKDKIKETSKGLMLADEIKENSMEFIKNLLIDYAVDNNIKIILNLEINVLYCHECTLTDLHNIFKIIIEDVVLFTALMDNIDKKKALENLNNKMYAKYFN